VTTAKDHWQQTLLAPCIEARGFVADCYRTGKTFQFEDYVRDHLSKMETYQEDVDLKWLEQDIQEILSSDRRQDLRIQVNELTRRYRVVPPELFEELAKCDSRLTGSARDLRREPVFSSSAPEVARRYAIRLAGGQVECDEVLKGTTNASDLLATQDGPSVSECKVDSEEESKLALVSKRSKSRHSFVDPILRDKGWSRRDWAANAQVEPKTAGKYLEGCNTYPDTRKKLADGLGVSVADLPE
jgi:hypothetical protein